MTDPVFIEYIPKNFGADRADKIHKANDIIEEYFAQGYDLTLRQLYYQFVARGYIENSQKSYNNLGNVISEARLAGLVPWNRITDRTRNVKGGGGYDSPAHLINSLRYYYRRNLWETQDTYVEVWVEKEALANVVERACGELNLPWFCCRGYVSQSEMYAASERFKGAGAGKQTVIVHLGDHDPSGIDMTRDIEERVNMLLTGDANWRETYGSPWVEVNRIALNMHQVRLYNPPPNPAKTTDARFTSYEAKHGDESWELDALEPDTLTDLIKQEVDQYIDRDAWDAALERQREETSQLVAVQRNWPAVQEFLRGLK